MIRSLRTRLFIAIFGTVVLAVGASLALGVLLTKNAVRDTIQLELERQVYAFSTQLARLPLSSSLRLRGTPPPPNSPPGGPARPGPRGGRSVAHLLNLVR